MGGLSFQYIIENDHPSVSSKIDIFGGVSENRVSNIPFWALRYQLVKRVSPFTIVQLNCCAGYFGKMDKDQQLKLQKFINFFAVKNKEKLT